MEDSIPSTKAGQILALADKLDNLREFFKIDMVPTGSKDPFALRRAAQGIVKILAETDNEYTLFNLANGPLLEFLYERLQYYFRDVRGYKYDEVKAVLAAGTPTLPEATARLKALAEVRSTEDFEAVAASCKRIRNILKDFSPRVPLSESLLEDGPERELHAKLTDFSPSPNYREQLMQIAGFRPVVDRFFDKVMVNVQDEKLRDNRLTLLHNLLTKFSTIADFSEIVTSGDQK
jgi:glycyl-tRNA synthetase beta chain